MPRVNKTLSLDYTLLDGFHKAFWTHEPNLLDLVAEQVGIPKGEETSSLQKEAYCDLYSLQEPLVKLLQDLTVARLELMRPQLITAAQQIDGLCAILGNLTRSLPGQALAARLERHVYEEIKETFPKREPFTYSEENWKSLQSELEKCQRALRLLGNDEVLFTAPDSAVDESTLNETQRFFRALGVMRSLMHPEWPHRNHWSISSRTPALWPKSEKPGSGRPSKECLMQAAKSCLPIVADAYQAVRQFREESTREITPEEWNGNFASKTKKEVFSSCWSFTDALPPKKRSSCDERFVW